MAIWHDFEKDAAEYFERSHQVFDSRKAERAVKRDSHTGLFLDMAERSTQDRQLNVRY